MLKVLFYVIRWHLIISVLCMVTSLTAVALKYLWTPEPERRHVTKEEKQVATEKLEASVSRKYGINLNATTIFFLSYFVPGLNVDLAWHLITR